MGTTKPLTFEAKMALTEKKMDMALDDIIKMAKKQHRPWNKTSRNVAKGGAQDKPAKVRHYLDTRSAMRQGVLAQRRSNFKGNQFPIAAAEAARMASVVVPRRNRGFNWKPQARAGNNVGFGNKLRQRQHQQQQPQQAPSRQRPQTLDLLLANIKEQRMRRTQPRRNNAAAPRNRGGRRFGNSSI